MPLQATSGAASYDAFGGGVPVAANYIESCFSTYLYTGTGSAQTITNGIDLSGKGGMVWLKARNDTRNNWLYDTVRGKEYGLRSDLNFAENYSTNSITSFNNNGFSIGDSGNINTSSNTLVSWTFREQPKFFDIVTWSGNSVAGRQIPHGLGSTPGCVIIKSLVTDQWCVWHRGLTAGRYIVLNSTAAQTTSGAVNRFGDGSTTVDPTSTYFTVGTNGEVNQSGNNYVAYIFAHDAGGFGLTGTDNVISCGSYTETSGTVTVNLGYEPQWLLVKPTSTTGNWYLVDNMRGFSQTADAVLFPNLSNAESAYTPYWKPTATGFTVDPLFGAGTSFIYIAIRRGPMKVPTDATKVFKPDYNASFPQPGTVTTNFVADWDIYKRTGGSSTIGGTRLTGGNYLFLNDTSAESAGSSFLWDSNTSLTVKDLAGSGNPTINWAFRRAPNFFDEVCYTGTGSATTVAHNLGAVPELMIIKARSGASNWAVYSQATGNTNYLLLNVTDASAASSAYWNNTTPTSTVFSLNNAGNVNANAATYVAYLFATCPGVSKCTSFTGTGTLQTIDCGFTSGSRFILIKRTDSTGDWYVWDSSRGLSSSTDPYLLLNSTAAEVTSTNWVDTTSTGFQVTAASGNNVNINGASYIALAIA